MNKIILMIMIFTSIVFTQNGKKFTYYLAGDGDEVYALDLDGSTEYVYKEYTRGLAITEYEYLRSSLGYLSASADSVKGSWMFDGYTNSSPITEDLSSRNNNFILYGDTVFQSSSPVTTSGNSVSLDGNDWFYIRTADATDFNFGSNLFSIEAWVKTTITDRRMYIVSKHDALNNYLLTFENGTLTFKVASGGNSKQLYSQDIVADGKWHYVVGTCNPSASANLYVDGTLEKTVSLSGYTFNINQPLVIGCVDTLGTDPFVGQMAQIRISKRLLGASEIRDNFYTFNESGFNSEWIDNGNHSISTTVSSPYEGTYSGSIIASGAGDTTSNYVSLNIKQPLVAGDKYLIQIYAKTLSDIGEIITVVIGDKSFTINPTTSFSRGYLHFKATTNTINKPIKIYCNIATNIIVDKITIKKKWDHIFLAWLKTSLNETRTILRNDGSTNEGYYLTAHNTNSLRAYVKDEYAVSTLSGYISKVYNGNVWRLFGVKLSWDGSSTTYLDDGTPYTISLAAIGQSRYISLLPSFRIGDFSDNLKWSGQLGEIQIIRCNDSGDFDPRTYYTNGKLSSSYSNGTVVAWWKWAGSTTSDFLKDHSAYGNNLTGINVDINDQVKIGAKYR